MPHSLKEAIVFNGHLPVLDGGDLGAVAEDVLDGVGEAKATHNHGSLNGGDVLVHVRCGEGLSWDNIGIDVGLGKLVALLSPHLDVGVLPLAGGEAVLGLHALGLGAEVGPVA